MVEIVRRQAPQIDSGFFTNVHMTIQRMEPVGIVVDDLAAATEYFVELGLELQGEGSVTGRSVDRIVGPAGVRAEIAVEQTPDGYGRLELTTFHTPSDQGDNRRPQTISAITRASGYSCAPSVQASRPAGS